MNRLGAIISAGAVAVMLSAGAQAADPAATQVEAAVAPSDHEAIAAGFDQEAARLDALAIEHQKMADAYKRTSFKKGITSASMRAHCAKLAKKYSEAAEENRALAKEHRAMTDHAGHHM